MAEDPRSVRLIALPAGIARTRRESVDLLVLLGALALSVLMWASAGSGFGRPEWWVRLVLSIAILIIGAVIVLNVDRLLVEIGVVSLARVVDEGAGVTILSRRRVFERSRVPVAEGSLLTLEVWTWERPMGRWPFRRNVRLTGARLLCGEAVALSFVSRGDLTDVEWEGWAKEVGGDDFDVVIDMVGDVTDRL